MTNRYWYLLWNEAYFALEVFPSWHQVLTPFWWATFEVCTQLLVAMFKRICQCRESRRCQSGVVYYCIFFNWWRNCRYTSFSPILLFPSTRTWLCNNYTYTTVLIADGNHYINFKLDISTSGFVDLFLLSSGFGVSLRS